MCCGCVVLIQWERSTPLHAAAVGGHASAMLMLLSGGARAHVVNQVSARRLSQNHPHLATYPLH